MFFKITERTEGKSQIKVMDMTTLRVVTSSLYLRWSDTAKSLSTDMAVTENTDSKVVSIATVSATLPE
jgi:capsular polysaccharide biosynthesis protein